VPRIEKVHKKKLKKQGRFVDFSRRDTISALLFVTAKKRKSVKISGFFAEKRCEFRKIM
jgi:hypothetical protein